jgi:hypothetical protein
MPRLFRRHFDLPTYFISGLLSGTFTTMDIPGEQPVHPSTRTNTKGRQNANIGMKTSGLGLFNQILGSLRGVQQQYGQGATISSILNHKENFNCVPQPSGLWAVEVCVLNRP